MKRIDLIGSPIAHVRSPSILNPRLRAAGDCAHIAAVEVFERDLPDYARSAREQSDVVGLIVTTPLKHAILAYLDRTTDLVRLIGASNCIRFDDGRWLGANFDGFGFVEALTAIAGRISDLRVLLVGCGGAGSAIAASLVMSHKVDLSLYDIDSSKPADLAIRLGAASTFGVRMGPAEPVGEFDVAINASTLGMLPDDPLPLPEETVARAMIVADIVAAENSKLKRLARSLGKPLVTGEAMVLGQAALLHRFLLSDAASESEVLTAPTGPLNSQTIT